MDQRILAVILGVAALALAGLAFAAGGQGMASGWQGSENATGCGMMRGGAGNGTFAQAGAPRFNSTEHEAFEAAVESGDFAAATKLHEEYGFGGPMFEKLNATTFAKFSQVHRLQSELQGELGLNATSMRQGMGGGRGMMEPEFAKGMRHGFRQGITQTRQQ
ncbi:MAG: hypothetical protein WC861_04130 [Candidatus Micrarchaeia archaeon]|jgi:hypothetical protein